MAKKPRDEYDIPMDDAIDLDQLLGPKPVAAPAKKPGMVDKAVDTLLDNFASKFKKPEKKGVDLFLDQAGPAADLYERTKPKNTLDDLFSGAEMEVDDPLPSSGGSGVGDFLSGKGPSVFRKTGRQGGRKPAAAPPQDVFDLDSDEPLTIDLDEPAAARGAAPAGDVFDLEGEAEDLSAWIGTETGAAPTRSASAPAGDAYDLDMEGEAIDLSAYAEPDTGAQDEGKPVAAEFSEEPVDLSAWGDDAAAEGEIELEIEGEAPADLAEVAEEEAPARASPGYAVPGGGHDDHHMNLEEEIFGVASPLNEGEFRPVAGSSAPEPEEVFYDLPAAGPRKPARRKPARQPVISSEPVAILPRFDPNEFDSLLLPLNDDVTSYTEDFVDVRRPVVPLIASPFDIVEEPLAPRPRDLEMETRPFAQPRLAAPRVAPRPVQVVARPAETVEPAAELELETEQADDLAAYAEEAYEPEPLSQDALLALLMDGEMLPPPAPDEEDELAAAEPEGIFGVAEADRRIAERPAGISGEAGQARAPEVVEPEASEEEAAYELTPAEAYEPAVEEPQELAPVAEITPEYEVEPAYEDAYAEVPAELYAAEDLQPEVPEQAYEIAAEQPAYEPAEPSEQPAYEPPVEEYEPAVEEPQELAPIAELAPPQEALEPEAEIGAITFVPAAEAEPGPPPAPAWQPGTYRFTLDEFPSIDDILPPLQLPQLSFDLEEGGRRGGDH